MLTSLALAFATAASSASAFASAACASCRPTCRMALRIASSGPPRLDQQQGRVGSSAEMMPSPDTNPVPQVVREPDLRRLGGDRLPGPSRASLQGVGRAVGCRSYPVRRTMPRSRRVPSRRSRRRSPFRLAGSGSPRSRGHGAGAARRFGPASEVIEGRTVASLRGWIADDSALRRWS